MKMGFIMPAGGSAGHYAGVLGDPLTDGVTMRYTFSKKKVKTGFTATD